MTTVNSRRKSPMKHRVVALAPLAIVLAGCAASAGGTAERRVERCIEPLTLVCYGRTATRAGDRSRLEQVDFCRCERVTDIH